MTTPTISSQVGLRDDGSVFPPPHKITVTPNYNTDISAVLIKLGDDLGVNTQTMILNYAGEYDSHTQWPSRIEYVMEGLDDLDPNTPSGLREYPAFYKVVIEDSLNPNNNPAFTGGGLNEVYVWIYFGKNRQVPVIADPAGVPINFLVEVDVEALDIPVSEADTINPTSTTAGPVVNNSTI